MRVKLFCRRDSAETSTLIQPFRRAISIARLLQQPVDSPEQAGRQLVELYRLIGTPATSYPLDVDWLTDVGAESFQRAYDPAGKLRQQAAMLAAPNRHHALSKVTLPTLIMHGTVDPLIRPKGAYATARAIAGAKLVMLKGVGHGAFPRGVWPIMIDSICEIAG